MGLCLAHLFVLASFFEGWTLEELGSYLSGGGQAALGLGLVIFVHELGHFAVAKWCGVQCDRFYVGFDIPFGRFLNWLMGKEGEFTLFGLKIPRTLGPPIQWGETQYGIGIVPLGGYVMMLGQSDDPSDFHQEQERSNALEGSPDAKQIVGPGGESLWVHKRSYRAKPVWQRMLIISAGVIMNVITAFLFAMIAFGIGVPRIACEFQSTTPGGPAWEANLRTGDRLTRIDDELAPSFTTFLTNVTLGDLDQGLDVDVASADGSVREGMQLKPRKIGPLPRVGALYSLSLRIRAEDASSGASFAGTKNGFEPGDLIVAVDGKPVANYAELVREQRPRKDQELTYTVVRGGKTPVGDPFGPVTGGERVDITMPANPRERLGIVPKLGPIEAIQQDSPAAEADLRPGDQIVAINGNYLGEAPNGEATWDPVTLDDRLADLAESGATANLTIDRGGEALEVAVTPRVVTWKESPSNDAPVAFSAFGIACKLQGEVVSLIEGSPAQDADLRPGDQIIAAQILSGEDQEELLPKPLEISSERPNWPMFLAAIQDKSDDAKAQLTIRRGEEEHQVELPIGWTDGSFAFVRGIPLEILRETHAASGFGEQAELALGAVSRNLMAVYRLLQKIIEGQVPGTVVGGPIAIFQQGSSSANNGIGSLLLFLTMLSANLAVINFLPIPMLDGGHMVFLAWEWVRGRPANATFVAITHNLGAMLLLALILFVFGLDLGLIDRGL